MASNIDTLAKDIAALVTLERNGAGRGLEIGRRLIEAKRQVRHGEWLKFVAQCGLTPRTSQIYMQAANKWKDDDAEAQRVSQMKLRDVWNMLKTPKPRGPSAPANFPTSNISQLPTACPTCGCACGFNSNEKDAA